MNKYNTKNIKEITEKDGVLFLGEYATIHDKYEFVCKCGEHFTTTWGKYLNRNKRHCNKCSYKLRGERQKKTVEDIILRLARVNKQLIGGYKNNKTKIKILCSCGNVYESTINNACKTRFCPYCVTQHFHTVNARYPVEMVKKCALKKILYY